MERSDDPMEFSLDAALYARAVTQTDRNLMERMAGQGLSPLATDASRPRVSLVVGPSPFAMMRGWEFFLMSPYEGVTFIATVLHNAGHPVRIIDVRYALDPLHEAHRQVMEGCDLVGIATYEDSYPFAESLISLIKDDRPDLPVILGGSFVTSVPHVFMKETRADVAVISEGELTVLELLDALADGTWIERLPEIHGIWYRDAKGQVRSNPPRGQMPHLDALPLMNLSLWPQSKDPRGLQPQINASISRGCKMDCSFCYRTTPQLREKSPERVRADLQHLTAQYNTRYIMFDDLTWTSDKRRTLENCEVLKEFDVEWGCMTRCADVDPEILKAMADAGCTIILFGVESLSADVLKEARKGNSRNLSLRALKMSQEVGIMFGGLLIVGLPGETEQSLDDAVAFAREYRSITRVKYLSAMPGTTVYHEALRKGILTSEVDHLRWLSVEQGLVHDEYLNYNGLPDRSLRRAYEAIWENFLPGPVMDWRHMPEHVALLCPDPSQEWRRDFSYVSSLPVPGVDRYRNPRLTPSVGSGS